MTINLRGFSSSGKTSENIFVFTRVRTEHLMTGTHIAKRLDHSDHSSKKFNPKVGSSSTHPGQLTVKPRTVQFCNEIRNWNIPKISCQPRGLNPHLVEHHNGRKQKSKPLNHSNHKGRLGRAVAKRAESDGSGRQRGAKGHCISGGDRRGPRGSGSVAGKATWPEHVARYR